MNCRVLVRYGFSEQNEAQQKTPPSLIYHSLVSITWFSYISSNLNQRVREIYFLVRDLNPILTEELE